MTLSDRLAESSTVEEMVRFPALGGPAGRLRHEPDPDEEREWIWRDTTIGHLRLDGKRLHVKVEEAVTSAELERTIEGASTLTIVLHDQARALVDSDLFNSRVVVEIDNLRFALVKVAKQNDDFTLTFEDDAINRLRGMRGPKRAFRDQVTRAEFVRSLIRDVKHPVIRFYCPEVHRRQPIGKRAITKASQRITRRQRGVQRKSGFGPGVSFTIKGSRASPNQVRNCERVLDVGASMGATKTVLLASIMTIIQESTAENLGGGDRDSAGLFQQRPSQGWGSHAQVTDPEHAAHSFFARAIGKSGSPGAISQSVQGSAFPHAYDQWRGEANTIVDAFHGGAGSPGGLDTTTTSQRAVRYAFSVGRNEDYWTAINRLAKEVQWRCFMVAGTFYFIEDTELYASRARMRLSEHNQSVDWINYEWDTGHAVAEATVECRANEWEAPPGTVVEITDPGPQKGRWLVNTIHRSLFSRHAEIKLHKPMVALPEPAPQVVTVTKTTHGGLIGGSLPSGGIGATKGKAGVMLRKATEIDSHNYPYVWGGGHNSFFSPPYDCSGGVSAVLHAGGLLGSPLTSGGLMSWGAPGPGSFLTVYAKGDHVFMRINGRFWGTSGFARPNGGAGFFNQTPGASYLSAFTVRHWPGL